MIQDQLDVAMDALKKVQEENRLLYQLLVDADAVAKHQGNRFGLCNALDPDGDPYPSAFMEQRLLEAQTRNFKPQLTLDDIYRDVADRLTPWYDPEKAKERAASLAHPLEREAPDFWVELKRAEKQE